MEDILLVPTIEFTSCILEAREGRVEEVGGEGRDHAAEEDLPGHLHVPEGRHLLHGEQEAAHRGTEGRSYACTFVYKCA